MKQLFSVVNMMHSQSIAHRNIHPGHIMLQIKKGQYLLKLIDFSSSCYSYMPKLKPPKPYRF
jgi:serine/threonine protein kinase